MIELQNDALAFRFPEVHAGARLTVDFQRTLRIPDDGEDHFLPPGLGRFPLRHVDDHADRVPAAWRRHGGVMLPMYQAEAMWLDFDSAWIDDRGTPYPFAVKIAAGRIDALTGTEWSTDLHDDPQDYVVVPEQPWLDGYCVEKGTVRQFVAMPLGAGYSAEEQITGRGAFGGLQIQAFPMKREVFDRRFGRRRAVRGEPGDVVFSVAQESAPDMGLAPGGRMRQEIHEDPFDLDDWDTETTSRCFVHLTNSLVWRAITGSEPPTTPITAAEYTRAGLPWFDHDSDAPAVDGAADLAQLRSVIEIGQERGDVPLPENESVEVDRVVRSGSARRPSVRNGRW